MPVNDWPNDANPADRTNQDIAAARAAIGEAKRLLGELHDDTTNLGDSFAAAGLAPRAWRSSGARLDELGDQFPSVTLDALLSRMSEFAADSGPAWLAGDGEALDDFEHEVQVLADVMRPLRVLAQRQRLTPPAERGRMPLERALGDGRVGAQLDRVVRTLRLLVELAPRLEPVPPEPAPAPAAAVAAGLDGGLTGRAGATMAAAGSPIFPGADNPAGRVFSPGGKARVAALLARMGRLRPGSWPVRRMWAGMPRRTRIAAVAALLVIGVSLSGVLVSAWIAGSRTHTDTSKIASSIQTGTGARGQTTPGHTSTAAASSSGSATPTPASARLAVSPTSVTLTCTGTGVALTVSNTGGQSLTWQASAPSYVVLSATSGTLGPHSSSIITARANGSHHGQGTITFKANGASVTVTFHVSCR